MGCFLPVCLLEPRKELYMLNLQELDKHFSIHEKVCAERWVVTIARIKRLESILLGCAGAILLLLLSIVFKVG